MPRRRKRREKQQAPDSARGRAFAKARAFFAARGGDLALAAIALAAAALRLRGMERPLWLDEAWVANSLLADSWRGMFFYDSWLQTSPPLFLLLARGAAGALGAANWALRLLPWLFGLAALACFAMFARRILRPAFAVLAAAVFAFSAPAIEHSRELKQFSAELLAATSLLWLACEAAVRARPASLRLVLAATAAAPCLGYGSVFFLPGIFATQTGLLGPRPRRPAPPPAAGSSRRLAARIAAGAAMAAVGAAAGFLLLTHVRGNTSPVLHEFWFGDGDKFAGNQAASPAYFAGNLLSVLPGAAVFLSSLGGVIAASVIAALILLSGLLAAWRDGRLAEAVRLAALCAAPMALMLAASLLKLYPWTDRTCLAMLPCLAVWLAFSLEAMWRAGAAWTVAGGLGAVLLAAPALTDAARQAVTPIQAREDMAAAVEFLASSAASADLIYVHTSAREAFRLYSRARRWPPPRLLLGETGWPCCARGVARRESFDEIVARHDLARQLPPGFGGRVWVIHTSRLDHWAWVTVNEPALIRNDLLARGCSHLLDRPFTGIMVTLYLCP
jgi:hypothetical protein